MSAVSLLVQLIFAYDVPSIARAESGRYLSAFIALWDHHRQPVSFGQIGVRLNLGALALATIWLRWFFDGLPPPARFLLRFVQVSAALSVGLVVMSWIPASHLPDTLLILMPSRLLNIDVLTCGALLFGLLAVGPQTIWTRTLTLALAAGLLLGDSSMFWKLFQERDQPVRPAGIDPWLVMAVIAVALVAGAIGSRFRGTRDEISSARVGRDFSPGVEDQLNERTNPETTRDASSHAGRRVAATAIRVLSLTVMFASGALTWRLADDRSHMFVDRTNEALFAAAARGSGLLLTGGDLHLVQLRTRRPVLIDGGGLDGLAYSLEAGPAMDRILREVYGIDLFNPPPEARGWGRIPSRANRAIWEHYSRQKWLEIGRAYRVTEVLTEADWPLDLPIVAQNRWYLLYRIPD